MEHALPFAVRFEQYLHQPSVRHIEFNSSLQPMDMVVWTAFFIARLKAILALELQSDVLATREATKSGF